MYFDQKEFNVRFEWGLDGAEALYESSDVIIIVDVISFSTSIDIAVSHGAIVFPYLGDMNNINAFASEVDAIPVYHKRSLGQYSLSPTSLRKLQPGTRLILPSLNGSRLSAMRNGITTFTSCFRNASAVAQAAQQVGQNICVIAAGEKWKNGNSRFAFEDLIGAGALISQLDGKKSPEAISCQNAYQPLLHDLHHFLSQCSSGKELIEAGFSQDINLASALDNSQTVPILVKGAYQAYID
jgi:2-phosphosulfolactate phosphatase